MTTTIPCTVHPSTRGVHYLYLNDGHGRMVGCIATVRRGSKLFLGTSFCSATGGDTFRKSQGRAIAEGRALRRASEQEKIMRVFTSKTVDQKSQAVQFLTRAQHALCVDLDLLADCSADGTRPNAFDVLKAILQSVIEFDSDLDDRGDDCLYGEEESNDACLCNDVLDYFANLELPGGLVRAARRKLTDVSAEASKRFETEVPSVSNAIRRDPTWDPTWHRNPTWDCDATPIGAVRAVGQLLPMPPVVLGPVIPPTATTDR